MLFCLSLDIHSLSISLQLLINVSQIMWARGAEEALDGRMLDQAGNAVPPKDAIKTWYSRRTPFAIFLIAKKSVEVDLIKQTEIRFMIRPMI